MADSNNDEYKWMINPRNYENTQRMRNKIMLDDGTPAGWFKESDLQIYWKAVMTCQPGDQVVELGSWLGRSCSMLFPAIKKTGAKMNCIDMWGENYADNLNLTEWVGSGVLPWDAFHQNMKSLGILDDINVIRECSWEASRHFEDESVQVVYIDADHTYYGVSRDIDAWYPKVKSGGWIGGHDFPIPDVKKAVADKLGNVQQRSGSSWGFTKK